LLSTLLLRSAWILAKIWSLQVKISTACAATDRSSTTRSPKGTSYLTSAASFWLTRTVYPLEIKIITPNTFEGEETRLREIAHRRKRKQIEFFNTESGRSLRLCSSTHEQRHSEKAQWCAICGKQNSDSVGHRSKFWCTVCTVHLCVRTYSGTHRSCWSMWHSQRAIKLRDSQRNQLRTRETESGEARAAHATEEAHPQNDATGAARGEHGTAGAQKHSSRRP
jgi:hypothetical protein